MASKHIHGFFFFFFFFFGYNPMAYHKRLAGFFIAHLKKNESRLLFYVFIDQLLAFRGPCILT